MCACLYGFETWSLSLRVKHRLMLSGKRVACGMLTSGANEGACWQRQTLDSVIISGEARGMLEGGRPGPGVLNRPSNFFQFS
jgi:hypothetical protein